MLELIAWEVLVFGVLGAMSVARSRREQAIAADAGIIFAGLLLAQHNAFTRAMSLGSWEPETTAPASPMRG